MESADALLAVFDAQRARMRSEVPDGVIVERDGPLVRKTGSPRRGFIEYRDLGGLEGPALDALIARQVRHYAARGEAFEWKLHRHDLPADLSARLLAAGLVPDPEEAVAVAEIAAVARAPELPPGVTLREVSADADLARIAECEAQVWGEPCDWLPESLRARLALDPSALCVVVAEARGEVVSAAWMSLDPGTPFADLNGGATLAAWRGRGIYRALVAHRALVAAERGCRYLHVDASDDSRPILERLGFCIITTTTPYLWTPPE